MFKTQLTADRADFAQILALQNLNHPTVLSADERAQQGFVTLAHTMKMLDGIRGAHGHAVAKVDGAVIGYALVMQPAARAQFDLLLPMFARLDAYNAALGLRYVVMGQICVARAYRGQGVFDALYHLLRDELSPHFDYVATEVSRLNTRSLHTHARVGFVPISGDEQPLWQTIVWDWRGAIAAAQSAQLPA
jgi:GNAT superfamily N-acetyltransferase